MEKWKKACILNSLIVILEVIAITWMIGGITESALAISGFRALRYFTVDSNILLGVFQVAVSLTYILMASEGFRLSSSIAYPAGIVFAAVLFGVYVYAYHKVKKPLAA